MRFSTKAIHIGTDPDPVTGAIMPPIYMTSTFALPAPGKTKGYDYTRSHNPNFTMLEKTLAALEDAQHCTVFSSGIGALTALISTLKSGDKVVGLNGLYGGTYRIFTQVFDHFGIEFINFTPKNLEELGHVLESKPKWLLFETPTNPLLEILDIQSLAALAKRHGVTSIVDNTFASPYCQNPLRWGADIVWHSTTKYIGGHSDVIGGAIISNSSQLKEQMEFARKSLGTNPSPFDVWLTLRGVKTLAVRMEQHEKNARAVAEFFSQHPKVKKVYYPGLESHPNHLIAKKQMYSFSGIVSAEFNLTLDQTKKLLTSFKYFSLAESLGGVESLVNHPTSMTHASIPLIERHKMGIEDGLVRFSIGIEDTQDLLEDLEQALRKI
jgi:cystathionine beta-lyase/cystathionine gamma-synthase